MYQTIWSNKMKFIVIKTLFVLAISTLGFASSGTVKKVEAQNCNNACSPNWVPCCSTPYCCITVYSCNPQSLHVYSANVCADGSRSCGACPANEDPGDPGPGDPGPSCYYPGSVQFGADALRKPVNNATGLDPAVIQFEWSRVANGNNVYAGQDWGHVDNPCVIQRRIYTVYLREAAADGTCSTNKNTYSPIDEKEYPATNAGDVTNGGTDPMIVPNVFKNDVLKYATTYCWYVKKENKVFPGRTTNIRKFTTEARPILVSTKILNAKNNAEVPTCGADIRRIGKYSATSTTIQNPMDIEVTFRDPDSTGNFSDLMVALIPTAQSNTEAQRITSASTITKITGNRTLIAKYAVDNTLTTKSVGTLNTSGTFSGAATSGDANNSIDTNATILSIGSATNITLTANGDGSRTIVAKFRIRFNDNFPNNTNITTSNFYNYYNIYSTMFFTRTRTNINNGNIVTTTYSADFDQTTMTGQLNYLKTDRIMYIDTTAPNPVLTSTTNPDSSFNVVWRANDNLALEPNTGFKTAVHASVAGDSLMQNYPSGTVINPVPTTVPLSSNLNAYLSLSNGVNYTAVYRDQNSGVTSNSIFTLDTDDLSCNNGIFQLTVTGLASPWLSVFNGNASIGNGLSGSNIPVISPYTQLFGLEDAVDSTQPHTTAYAFLIGTSGLPSSHISKKRLYANSYDDYSDTPPVGSSWYAYMLDRVKESPTPITTYGNTTVNSLGTLTASQDMSTVFGVATGAKHNFIINGNLVINPRNNCDLRSVFVVSGTISIHSDFQIKENASLAIYNGCIFVSQGDVTLTSYTPNSSRFKFATSGEHSTYGLFEANILTDGNIHIVKSTASPIGAFIVGNLTTRGYISSNTVFVGNTNLTKPSILVYSDPRYIFSFMDELGTYSYSIREEGLSL